MKAQIQRSLCGLFIWGQEEKALRLKIKLLSVCSLLTVLMTTSLCKPEDGKPSQLYQDFVKTLKAEQAANEKWLKWQKEKSQLNEEILRLKLKIRYLQFKNKQLDNYINTVSDKINVLEQNKKEYETLKMQLEPYLNEVVEKLEAFIKEDLPFFAQERTERIAFIRSTLNDYELSLSEKTRRILQAVIVEAKYGNTSDVTDQFLQLKEGTEPFYVRTLRIGRIGLFYLTPDSSACGMYDRSSKSWKPVSDHIKHNVQRAADIVEGKKRAKWIELPFPRISQ